MEENRFKNLEYRINFIKLREVWRNPDISKGAKVILMDLLLYGGVQGDIFPSQNTLAKNHDYSVKHIRNLLKELRANGLIDWDKFGYSATNSYFTIEELYCRIDERTFVAQGKSTSSQVDTQLPNQLRSPLPTNISQEISPPKESHPLPIKCENNCDNGIIFDPTDNTASYCDCPKGKQHITNSSY